MTTIRAAGLDDIESIGQIYTAASGANRKINDWQRLIAAGGLFLAEFDNKLAGFGAIDVQASEQIKYIYVAPQFQNAGIGAKLLDRLETIGRIAGLQTITLLATPPAVAFYRRAGYNPVESESHHDHDGVMMRKWL